MPRLSKSDLDRQLNLPYQWRTIYPKRVKRVSADGLPTDKIRVVKPYMLKPHNHELALALRVAGLVGRKSYQDVRDLRY